MAAVTINGTPIDNVSGSLRQRLYNISIATTGDTLAVAFQVKSVGTNDVAITKSAVTYSGGISTVTFSTTGAVNNALVNVEGEG